MNLAVYFAVGVVDAFAFFDPPFMIGVVFAVMYPLSRSKYDEVRRQLAERRAVE